MPFFCGKCGSTCNTLYRPYIYSLEGTDSHMQNWLPFARLNVCSKSMNSELSKYLKYADVRPACAYRHGDTVTSLFTRAAGTQQEIGCDAEKQLVIEIGFSDSGFPYDIIDLSVPSRKNGKIAVLGTVY